MNRLAEAAAFEYVGSSEINANPAGNADWEKGVWTLPPTLRNGETGKAKYLAIGESDRMTLKFRKAVKLRLCGFAVAHLADPAKASPCNRLRPSARRRKFRPRRPSGRNGH